MSTTPPQDEHPPFTEADYKEAIAYLRLVLSKLKTQLNYDDKHPLVEYGQKAKGKIFFITKDFPAPTLHAEHSKEESDEWLDAQAKWAHEEELYKSGAFDNMERKDDEHNIERFLITCLCVLSDQLRHMNDDGTPSKPIEDSVGEIQDLTQMMKETFTRLAGM